MKKLLMGIFGAAMVFGVIGCTKQQSTLGGAAIGATGGALVGGAVGGTGGAVVGGLAGGAAGAVIGNATANDN